MSVASGVTGVLLERNWRVCPGKKLDKMGNMRQCGPPTHDRGLNMAVVTRHVP